MAHEWLQGHTGLTLVSHRRSRIRSFVAPLATGPYRRHLQNKLTR